jgi:hypothetical protein
VELRSSSNSVLRVKSILVNLCRDCWCKDMLIIFNFQKNGRVIMIEINVIETLVCLLKKSGARSAFLF